MHAPRRSAQQQQRRLIGGDLIALASACVVVTALMGGGHDPGIAVITVLVGAGLGLAGLRSQRLWDEHRIAVRAFELAGLARSCAWIVVGLVMTDRLVDRSWPGRWIAASSGLSLVLLVAWRAMWRVWVVRERRRGRLMCRTVIVGSDARAMELVRVVEVHPEAGTQIVGIIGSRTELQAQSRGELWLGEVTSTVSAVAAVSPDRIVIASGDIPRAQLDELIHAARHGGPHIVFHAGVPGVATTRLSTSAIANDAVLHVARARTAVVTQVAKRAVDIVAAGALIVATAPVMAVVAALVRLDDGGPVLFRQQRVGRGGQEFGMLKFRTMGVDADDRLEALRDANQRCGPLFKLAHDPRVTRVGDVLRRTSLDELPQLFNVLRGEMSLVGPRPALRREVDAFPADLQARHGVRPGITGMWQVEARDNPAFDAYHRLDLHYVRNWSPTLDLVLVVATVEQMVGRLIAGRGQREMATADSAGPIAVGTAA